MFDRLSRRFYYTHTSVLQLTARRIFYALTEVVIVADDFSNKMFSDIVNYTSDVVEKAEDAAKKISKDMAAMAEVASPVRHYSTHTQTVKRIVVHRAPPTVPKAIREVKDDKYQPGYFKKGWTTGQIKLKNGKIFGARNRNMPTVVHLVHFGHNLITHGKGGGIVQGSYLLDHVQEWGEREFERQIDEFLDKE